MSELTRNLFTLEGGAVALWAVAAVVLLAHKWYGRRVEAKNDQARQSQDMLNANMRRIRRH